MYSAAGTLIFTAANERFGLVLANTIKIFDICDIARPTHIYSSKTNLVSYPVYVELPLTITRQHRLDRLGVVHGNFREKRSEPAVAQVGVLQRALRRLSYSVLVERVLKIVM